MSFKILRVTERAHGGDPIERTKLVAGNEASIGRGTDCDLQLPDLTLGLRHATMRITERGRVTVESAGDQTFEHDGRIVRRAELRLSAKPVLRFGQYDLSFAQGDSPDEVVVTITRSANAIGESDTTLAKRAFSLGPIMFSLRGAAWLLFLLMLGIGLAAPAFYYFYTPSLPPLKIAPDEQWSAGPLSSGHAFLQHNCEACHAQAFRSIPDSACLTCHRIGLDAEAANRLAEKTFNMGAAFAPHPANDHAALSLLNRSRQAPAIASNPVIAAFESVFTHPGDRCVDCHTEHVGTAGQRPPRDAPAHPTQAQVSQSGCASCHAALKAHIPDTALIDVTDWEHHPDFRGLIATLYAKGRPKFETDAATDGPFDTGLKFSHKQHLATTGDVAREASQYGKPLAFNGALSCSACHHPDADGRGFLSIEMTRDCSACHSLQIPGVDGRPAMLPHAQPDKVVDLMRVYFRSGGTQGLSSGRERPGLFHDTGVAVATISDSDIAAKVRGVFMNNSSGPHPCFGCHVFTAPSDPGVLEFRIVPVHLVDTYLPRSGFDHAVPQHRVDANGKPFCMTCHAAQASDSLSNVVIPGIGECRTCHGARSRIGTEVAASNCTECHGYHSLNEPPTREQFIGPWKIPSGM